MSETISGKANPMLIMIDAFSHERGIEKDVIIEAIESALAAIVAKRYIDEEPLIRVVIDAKTGEYQTLRIWTVVSQDAFTRPDQQITLSNAIKSHPAIKEGELIQESLEAPHLGRIAAQQARHLIAHIIKQAEREKTVEHYQQRLGELLTGVVKSTTRDSIILDISNNAEALLTRDNMIPRESFRLNDRVKVYLYAIRNESRGAQLLVTRTHPGFLIELFKIEVPEISEEIIQLKSAARDPGFRAKIAVKTNDGRVDPVGACVGMRGSRVQAVSNEMGGERIDIILWDSNPAQMVINAMAPAEVESILVDEDLHAMDIIVKKDTISQAIGRYGQNIRLASELTGWHLNVMDESQAAEKKETEQDVAKNLFLKHLNIQENIAIALLGAGLTNLEEIAYSPIEDIYSIDTIDQATATHLQNMASNVLLAQEMANTSTEPESIDDLATLSSMTPELLKQLTEHQILTRDDLADQSIEELLSIIDLDREQAASLIMQARAHWFSPPPPEGENPND